MIQLVCCIGSVVFQILRPLFGLGLCNELTQDIHVDALRHIMLAVMYPLSFRILAAELRIATGLGDQKGFYVPFKSLFTFIHQDTSSWVSALCFVDLALYTKSSVISKSYFLSNALMKQIQS